MINRFKQFLNQPYPDRDTITSMIIGALVAGLIVSCILFFFKPFGLDRLGDRLLLISIKFGLISAAVSLALDGIIRFGIGIRRDTSQWTLWKWLLTVSVLIICITMANYVFITRTFGSSFTVENFLTILYSTVLIGIFPTSIFGGVNLIRKLRTNQRIAASIDPHPIHDEIEQLIELPIHNSSKTFAVDVSKILYIEAMQNYVRIIFHDVEGVQQESLRNTIANTALALNSTSIQRCHRSFLVNVSHIEEVSGNAQGLKLRLTGLQDVEVPVSRKYISLFKEQSY